MRWRVVITDSEQPHGVAPVCLAPEHPVRTSDNGPGGDGPLVEDCCPKPHLECSSSTAAFTLARKMTFLNVEVCS